MRSFILMAVGLAALVGSLPVQIVFAQSDGGIARLSSAAYQPDSPVTENRLFRYQTGHYGFAYNCDGEENKRNHPSICWRCADREQLPRRMGCLERMRHEAAQVSRRILDGMCDSDCGSCQQQKPDCGCAVCLAQQGAGEASAEPTVVAELEVEQTVGQAAVAIEPMIAGESVVAAELDIDETVPANSPAPATKLAPATDRRSGLIRLTKISPTTEPIPEVSEPVLASAPKAEPEGGEHIQPPVARITSVTTGSGVEATDSHDLGLLERLKIIQSSQASGTTKVKKF